MNRTNSQPNSLVKTHDAIEEAFPVHLDRCRAFLRQKSISATGEGIYETAEQVKDFIEEIGGEVSFKETRTIRSCMVGWIRASRKP